MRPILRFLLLDQFNPDTGELALRVAFQPGEGMALEMLRLRLHLGRPGQALETLARELRAQLQTPLPALWGDGLKLIIHALEEELRQPEGRQALRYLWVRTQILHPTDEDRSTPNHPVARQVEILRDWSYQLDQEGESDRVVGILERLLMLAPRDVSSLATLARYFRGEGMAEETASLCERWLNLEPHRQDAQLWLGESLLRLGRASEAQAIFEALLRRDPVHLQAHLGMAQALSLLGGNPFPHLDAAQELDATATASVLRDTFDYRLLQRPTGDREHPLADLPGVLGVSGAELQDFISSYGLPMASAEGPVQESELARWVGVMNRYALLNGGLHWSAPTPRHLPELR